MDLETIDLDTLCRTSSRFNDAMTSFVSSRPVLNWGLMAMICEDSPELEELWDNAMRKTILAEIEKCKRDGKTEGTFKIADVLDATCDLMIDTIMDDIDAHSAFLKVTLKRMAARCKNEDEFCRLFIAVINEAQEDK